MAYITEEVLVVSVSVDPPPMVPGMLGMAMPGTTPTPPTSGTMVLQFDDGTRVSRAVPLTQISQLAALVNTKVPLSLG